jgi:hypothetical protein
MKLFKDNRSAAWRGKVGMGSEVGPIALTLALGLIAPRWMPLEAAQRSVNQQITEAVSPLKSDLRAGATVLGYSGRDMTVLRQGTNYFICLADNPSDRRFQVSCYHKSLEPFMARGRELRSEGKRGNDRQRIRNAEIDAGQIEMPNRASVISLYGIGEINSRTGWPDSVATLQVIYLPYATAEETGLDDRPSRTTAYLMDAGTARAHLMVPGDRRKFRPQEPMRRR